MRIRELTVQSVLHFERQELDFSGKSGLQLIYGANEAGKSTMLQVLVDLLFGGKVEEAQKDLYHSRSRLSGTLSQEGEPEFTIVRRKQRTQLVLADARDQVLGQEVLQPYLGTMTRERYRLLFGFDHERLRIGGESLLASDGHAGISLFEAGGGVQLLQGALAGLGERVNRLADLTFRSNSTRLLNTEWRLYQEAVAKVRDSGLRGEDWLALREDIEAMERQVAQFRREQGELEKTLTSVRRVQRVYPVLLTWRALHSQLQTFDDVPVLAQAWEQHIPTLYNALHEAQKDIAQREQALAAMVNERATHKEDPAIFGQEVPLRHLFATLDAYRQTVRDMPRLEQQVQDLRTQVLSIWREVAPNIDLQEIEKLRTPLAEREQIRAVAQLWQNLHVQLEAAEEGYDKTVAEVAQRERVWQQCAAAPDSTPLQGLLKLAMSWGDVDDNLLQWQKQWSASLEDIRLMWSRQTVCRRTVDEAVAMSIPLMATIERYEREWLDRERDARQLEQQWVEANKDLAHLGEQLETLSLMGQVPVEADLTQARAHRQTGWQWVKRVWLEGVTQETVAFGEEASLPDAYEAAVKRADEVADRLRREADRSAQRAQWLAQKEQRELDIARFKQASQEADRQWTLRMAAWQGEWVDLGQAALSPTEMKAWLQEVWTPLVQAHARVSEMKREHLALSQRKIDWVRSVARMLADAGLQDTVFEAEASGDQLPLTEWSELVGRLERIVRHLDDAHRQRAESAKRVEESQEALLSSQRKRSGVQAQLAECQGKWQTLIASFPTLPPDPAAVTRYLDRVRDLFQAVEDYQRAKSDLARHVQAREAFEQRSQAIAGELPDIPGSHLEQPSVESLITYLHQRMEDALQEDRWLAQSARDISRAQTELASVRTAQEADMAQWEAYRMSLGAADSQALLQLIDRALERRQLQEEQAQVKKQLTLAGDERAPSELEEEVASVLQGDAFDRLEERAQGLLQQKSELNEKIDSLAQTLGVKRERLRLQDGSQATAAQMAQEAENRLAQVDRLWQEYVRAALARKLLERGIEIFRGQTESLILGRASEIFARLTLHRYRELTVEYEETTPYLYALAADGSSRRISQLSDGTRDQLHLALRLSFVEHYMAAEGPLPLIMDDILVHFDDERAAATLEVLRELSAHTQVIYFTHHKHIAALMLRLAGADAVRLHELGESPALSGRVRIQ